MLVAGFGIPGSGKSTVMQRLSRLLDADCYLEPEEEDWGVAVDKRDVCGHVTALHYFRAARVPMLYEARAAADNGHSVFIDSIYDKLCHLYIQDSSFHWLMQPADNYYKNFLELCRLDYENLPDPDILIFFEVDETDWQEMVGMRGRNLDKSSNLATNLQMQAVMLAAAERYEMERGGRVKLIRFQNTISSVDNAAAQLASLLQPSLGSNV